MSSLKINTKPVCQTPRCRVPPSHLHITQRLWRVVTLDVARATVGEDHTQRQGARAAPQQLVAAGVGRARRGRGVHGPVRKGPLLLAGDLRTGAALFSIFGASASRPESIAGVCVTLFPRNMMRSIPVAFFFLPWLRRVVRRRSASRAARWTPTWAPCAPLASRRASRCLRTMR